MAATLSSYLPQDTAEKPMVYPGDFRISLVYIPRKFSPLDGWAVVDGLTDHLRRRQLQKEQTSTGVATAAVIDSPAIATNKEICTHALGEVDRLPGGEEKDMAHRLLVDIQECIRGNRQYRELTPFRPISFEREDDGTVVLEWAYPNGRISFYLDPVIKDSTAVFVDGLDQSRPPVAQSDWIFGKDLSALAERSVRFAARCA